MSPKTGMNKKEAKPYYDLLLKKKQELMKGIEHIANDALKTSQRDATGDLSAYSLHMADVATDNYDREFSLSLADNEQKLLNRINAALERIEASAFGLCDLCEKKTGDRAWRERSDDGSGCDDELDGIEQALIGRRVLGTEETKDVEHGRERDGVGRVEGARGLGVAV